MVDISRINNLLSSAKNIAILEPHYDDAWINLGGFILKNPDKQFTILSCCFDGPNSLNETRLLSSMLPNVKTLALLFEGIHYNDGCMIEENKYQDFFVKLNKLSSYTDFEDVVLNATKGFDLVLLPKGFRGKKHFHAQHILVSRLKVSSPSLYYIEYPYFFKENTDISNFFIVDVSDVLAKKFSIFKDVYKSQDGIFKVDTLVGKFGDFSKEVFAF